MGIEGWAVGIEGWVVGTEGWRERISAVGPGNRGIKMGNGRVGSDNLVVRVVGEKGRIKRKMGVKKRGVEVKCGV